jgi:flagellar hook-associated protein 2
MSTQPISSGTSATSSNQYASGQQLTSLSGGGLQITGLASGLNTNAVVQALMAAQQQQVTNLQNQQSGITALNNQLTSIQTALQTVADDAQALGDPSLFANAQTITSTNSTLVNGTASGSNGAVVGSYALQVTALASASQETFTFNSPVSGDTLNIGTGSYTLAANATADDLANQINSDPNGSVWATVTQEPASSGGPATVVLSDRNTGVPTGNDLTPTSGTSLTNGTNYIAGTNAAYTINNGPPQQSTSNTISGAPVTSPNTGTPGATETIPGVTLNLNGITGSTPVTVTVGSPAPSTQTIQTAVQKFITDYNSAISQIQTQLSQTPSSSDPTQGTLYNDSDLTQLLSSMRQMMASTVNNPDLPPSMSSMLGAGVSTGATTGSGAISQSALAGDLTLDTTTLTNALTSNASDVKSMFTSWSIQFSALVNNEAAPGGTISTRIQADGTQSSYLATQIQNLTEANTIKQNELVQEFAAMEAALSQNQSTSSWLTSQLAALPTP